MPLVWLQTEKRGGKSEREIKMKASKLANCF